MTGCEKDKVLYMKKVSVIVPCYNATEYIERCMRYLLGQTIGIENMEIILVDDASTDEGKTFQMLLEYEAKYPDTIIVISLEQNMRQGGARNAGISYAGGEYLMFCDVDDWLVPDAMERLYRIAKDTDADVVEFQNREVTDNTIETEIFSEDEKRSQIYEFGEEEEKRQFIMASSENCALGCWTKFYRMSIIQDNRIRFAEHLICEEPSFTLPVRFYEKRHVLTNEIFYCYYQSPDSTIRSSWDERKFDNMEVWMILIEDLRQRGFLEPYHKELECMFFEWGFGMSIRMLVARGYMLTKEELNLFKENTLQLFPEVLHNPYVITKDEGWNLLMKGLLEMELTDENVPELNHLMKYFLQRYQELCNEV